MSSEQDLIRIPDEMRERLAKRLKENGMVMFTRIDVQKYGVSFYWDGVSPKNSGGSSEIPCPIGEKPECAYPGRAECDEQTGTWSCQFPN